MLVRFALRKKCQKVPFVGERCKLKNRWIPVLWAPYCNDPRRFYACPLCACLWIHESYGQVTQNCLFESKNDECSSFHWPNNQMTLRCYTKHEIHRSDWSRPSSSMTYPSSATLIEKLRHHLRR